MKLSNIVARTECQVRVKLIWHMTSEMSDDRMRMKNWQYSSDASQRGCRMEEMMNKGLIDIGIFLEPVDIKGYDYIRLNQSDCWVVGIRPDDPLAKKEYITKEDLLDKPLILPKRENLQIELENWFGKDIQNLIVPLTSNLGTNAGIMAMYGLGYPLSVGGAVKYWREDLLVQRKLYPEIIANTIIAWRRNIPHSLAVKKFIKEMKVLE